MSTFTQTKLDQGEYASPASRPVGVHADRPRGAMAQFATGVAFIALDEVSADPPPLSAGALNAPARAVRTLDLRAVRLICASADGLRAARLGVPTGELIDPHSLVPAS